MNKQSMRRTNVYIQPLPIWEDEWEHPETHSNLSLRGYRRRHLQEAEPGPFSSVASFKHIQAFLDNFRGQIAIAEIPPIRRATLAAEGMKRSPTCWRAWMPPSGKRSLKILSSTKYCRKSSDGDEMGC